jgi:succinate dehydrogenase hydrophobic anchor subunit
MSLTEMSLADRRMVYGKAGTPTPYWMWIFQRISGLLLGPLVIIHVVVPDAPKIEWVSTLLLLIILGHAFIGTWRLAAMRRIALQWARFGVMASVLFVLLVGVFGVALILSI